MKISIVVPDSFVVVDGVGRRVDLAGIDSEIHAVQFDTERGAGHVEFSAAARVEVQVRDAGAERAAHEAAKGDPAKLNALRPIHKTERVRRGNETLTSFAPFEKFVTRWRAAAPKRRPS